MKHRVAHTLDRETARRVLRAAAADYAGRLAHYEPVVRFVTEDRAEVSFASLRRSLRGSVTLEPDAIVFEAEVPLLLRPLKARAIAVIEREVRRWIARARDGSA